MHSFGAFSKIVTKSFTTKIAAVMEILQGCVQVHYTLFSTDCPENQARCVDPKELKWLREKNIEKFWPMCCRKRREPYICHTNTERWVSG
jgi:hypothetical protein